MHGQQSTGSGAAARTNPGLVNQGHGFDLGIDPVGPLILSVPFALRGHSQAAQTVWMRGCCKQCRLMVLGGRLSVVSSHYLMMPNTRSISFRYHISPGVFLELMGIAGKTHSCWLHASILERVVGPGATRQVPLVFLLFS